MPVTGHHPRTPGYYLASLAHRHGLSPFVHDPHFDIIQRFSNRSQTLEFGLDLFRTAIQDMVIRREHCDGRRGLGLAEGIDEPRAGEPCDGLPDDFERHGRRTVGDDAERREIVFEKVRVLHDMFQHGRHQHGPVDLLLLGQAQPFPRIELPHHHQGPPAVDRGESGLKSGDVVEGHGDQVAFLYLWVGRFHSGQQVGGETVVGQHHSLGYPGGAGGEHYHRGVFVSGLREMHLVR